MIEERLQFTTALLRLFFFPIPFIIFAFCSLSLLVVTRVRGHIAGSSPPLPTTVRALHKCREISSLVDSRRTVFTHARRSQQLIFLFLQINSKYRHGGIRTHTSPPGRPAICTQLFRCTHGRFNLRHRVFFFYASSPRSFPYLQMAEHHALHTEAIQIDCCRITTIGFSFVTNSATRNIIY